MKRKITLLLMALMVMTTAFSQTTRSKGESLVPGASSPKGDDWEIFTFEGKSYNYFKGNDAIDNITVENLLGEHWPGNEFSSILENGDTVYLCNVATGEYLLVGDYWGETSMTNHVGMPYVFLNANSTRQWGTLSDMSSGTYWIQPTGVREERVIGRASRNDGEYGHFEHNGYLFLRNQKEYEYDTQGQSGDHPGGFAFKLKPVTTADGKQAYFIYTHRKTEFNTSGDNKKRREYENRDSYLMISSIPKADNELTDYTRVRFKKFAGEMYGTYSATNKVILNDKTDLDEVTSVTTTGKRTETYHKYGRYSNPEGGTTYTTNSESGLADVTLTASGNYLHPYYYGGDNYKFGIGFNPDNTSAQTLTVSVPEGYVIDNCSFVAISTTSGRTFSVTAGSETETVSAPGTKSFSTSNINSRTFTINITAANADADQWLCFPEFKLSIREVGTNASITLSDGTNTVADDIAIAKTTAEHKYGTYSAPAGGTTYTSNATSGLSGVTVTADGEYLRAGYFSNSKYGHAVMFNPNNSVEHTVTVSVPSGYVITGYDVKAIVTNGDRTYDVKFEGESNATPVGTNRKTFAKSGLAQETLTFVIKAKDNNSEAPGVDAWALCFPIFNITVAQIGDVIPGAYAFENNGEPRGDEVAYFEAGRQNVSFSEGLAEVINNPNNQWKLVTKKQRDRYRIVASDKKPVDVSSRIFNPKFNTTYIYNVKKADCNWDSGDSHWELKTENLHPDYGWTWYNTDRPEHDDEVHKQHVHPHNLASTDNGYWGIGNEFHKIGTGQFFRFWDTAGGKWDDGQEIAITYGQEANYCGSIYKGTANVQQTITALREGNYIVFVRGFFAPHNMLKYTKSGDTYQFNGETMAAGGADISVDDHNWKTQALIRVDTDEDGEPVPVWRRSHDSYLFAWSHPKGKTRKATQEDVDAGTAANPGDIINLPSEEVRRMLPSVYEGATKIADIGTLSKEAYFDGDDFRYTQVGQFDTNTKNSVVNLMKDANVYAFFNDGFFDITGSESYIVPKTIYGAGRFFNATDAETHEAAQNYRIGLPVYVGPDGELTIGVDHTYVTGQAEEGFNSGEHEWVCFDEFELIYLGAEEDEIFMVDELNKQGYVPSYKYINGYTGKEFKDGDKNQPGLWDSGLDSYYDAAMAGNDMSPANTTLRENNSQLDDIFSPTDIAAEGLDARKVKTLLIRRTMSKDNWNYIVLPVPLSRNQVEEGFGVATEVSQLKTVQNRTLVYEAVDWDEENKDAAYLLPGKPYIIRPSANPTIGVGDNFERPTFTVKESTTTQGVAGLYLKSAYSRNFEIDHSLEGPIYVIEDVEIRKGTVFPNATETYGADQWTVTSGLDVPVKVANMSNNFRMVETAHYENPATGVPAHSYYLNKGKWRYTSTGFSTTKGMLSYIQLIDQANGEALARPFLDGTLDFEIVEDINGIEDVNDDIQPDGKIEIYDMMGRRVKRTGKGLYIMNGKKVLFK